MHLYKQPNTKIPTLNYFAIDFINLIDRQAVKQIIEPHIIFGISEELLKFPNNAKSSSITFLRFAATLKPLLDDLNGHLRFFSQALLFLSLMDANFWFLALSIAIL